jgi:hypothetical protein
MIKDPAKGAGTTLFPPQMGIFPESALLRWNKVLKINVIEFLALKIIVLLVIY